MGVDGGPTRGGLGRRKSPSLPCSGLTMYIDKRYNRALFGLNTEFGGREVDYYGYSGVCVCVCSWSGFS